jgi:hypothetical protein
MTVLVSETRKSEKETRKPNGLMNMSFIFNQKEKSNF